MTTVISDVVLLLFLFGVSQNDPCLVCKATEITSLAIQKVAHTLLFEQKKVGPLVNSEDDRVLFTEFHNRAPLLVSTTSL